SHPIESANEPLEAFCACGNIRFHITRPIDGPRRNFPDLVFPDKTTDELVKRNPADKKWWIQDNGNKYLAGTCACRSCRLIYEFEVQAWTFVPRANII
ncbi:hypothetical protein B0T10DRAFT_417118, partial [Thelonectria olida]